ncbi:MAG: hypothetical protein H6899_14755 [Rhodobacter sp.]|nr:hypothetical protein [Rhodobacter sp.]
MKTPVDWPKRSSRALWLLPLSHETGRSRREDPGVAWQEPFKRIQVQRLEPSEIAQVQTEAARRSVGLQLAPFHATALFPVTDQAGLGQIARCFEMAASDVAAFGHGDAMSPRAKSTGSPAASDRPAP